ncbi:helix-turn-helix transcriptional regulator [Congzhengia sp.]|uniref:helix-turn-helix domain-containing protein n=1 Tax=Congzhengia sp. TaxID=2944168 RepID=UPI003077B300
MQNEQIAKRIKRLCKENNITAKFFLEEVGLNKNFIQELEKGKSPTVKNLTKIADYFDCSLDYLAGRSDKE